MANWFQSWFDSPYYSLLYAERDEEEAAHFIRNLVNHLQPDSDAVFLDLACGTGRHAKFLADLGYEVQGADYSQKRINKAKESEREGLSFYVQDMRESLPRNYDYILNLFTSFGYFDNDDEHFQTLKNVSDALNPGGEFILDFLNVEHVQRTLIPSETCAEKGVEFQVNRRMENGCIIKEIQVNDQGKHYAFKEVVCAYQLDELAELMERAGLQITNTFGNYEVDTFEPSESDRLIIIGRK